MRCLRCFCLLLFSPNKRFFYTPIMRPNKPADTTDRLIRPVGRFSTALILHRLIGEERNDAKLEEWR